MGLLGKVAASTPRLDYFITPSDKGLMESLKVRISEQ